MLANPLAFLVQSLHFGDTSTLQIARVVHVPAAMKMVRNSELSNDGESEGGGWGVVGEGGGGSESEGGRGTRIERERDTGREREGDKGRERETDKGREREG